MEFREQRRLDEGWSGITCLFDRRQRTDFIAMPEVKKYSRSGNGIIANQSGTLNGYAFNRLRGWHCTKYFGSPGRIRTYNPSVNSRMLYR